ncbi:alginate lyase family protein [Mucilaginibacter sp. P25]|uniref:Alginate lyase n=1 Tax=Mucilaginibacter gossypii TaxID=551996 RepID=A0A1G7ZJ63_9SPHI|nr:alginate lyase family protein [Mucilaginibacter gossypii]SDH08617.1 Alginate lyase [Mucilaginibacter gossypii]
MRYNKTALFTFLLLLLSFSLQAQENNKTKFVHPGILNTRGSLDLISTQLKAGDTMRIAAYQKVLDFIKDHEYPASFPSTIVVGSNGATSPSKTQIRKDCELVYALALAWAATGNADYAKKAIGLLNGWAYAFKDYGLLEGKTTPNQPDLEASWTTPSFVAAAEIIRYYKVQGKSAGWAVADIEQFSKYLINVKDNYINKIPDYKNNWDASAGYAKMAIGVFLDQDSVYRAGHDLLVKELSNIIQPDGTLPELCVRKDCVHYQYSLTAYAYAAAIAKIQGDNSLWKIGNKNISLGYDFMRKAYEQKTGCDYCNLNSRIFPGVEVAYGHYNTDNLNYLRGLQAPLGVPVDNTFLGFTTYTHYKVKGL